MRQYICDRCGKPIKNYQINVNNVTLFHPWNGHSNSHIVDLCEECINILNEINSMFMSDEYEHEYDLLNNVDDMFNHIREVAK